MREPATCRLPSRAHYDQPWRIHKLAADFRLEDVWALPATGTRDDFHRLIRLLSTSGTAETASPLTRLLFAVRRAIGNALGWDATTSSSDPALLRHRLPLDLRDQRVEASGGPFMPLYETRDEWAAELANRTVHGVLHLGWVDDGAGHYRGQLAVLVKPNGRLGSAYLSFIRPFRYAIVYPALLRAVDRKWRADALTRP